MVRWVFRLRTELRVKAVRGVFGMVGLVILVSKARLRWVRWEACHFHLWLQDHQDYQDHRSQGHYGVVVILNRKPSQVKARARWESLLTYHRPQAQADKYGVVLHLLNRPNSHRYKESDVCS